MIDAKVFTRSRDIRDRLKVSKPPESKIFKFTGKTPIKMMMELKNLKR